MSARQFRNAEPPFYSPLCLSAELVASAATLNVGALASAQAVSLRNPNRTAMLVDQFRFQGNPWLINNLPGIMLQNVLSNQNRVNIMLGSIPLTKDFVPLPALCPTYGLLQTYTAVYSALQPTLTWHLPRPMYVPPDVAISMQFKRFPFASTIVGQAFTGPLRVSVIGRSLPSGYPTPPEIFVPWATSTKNEDVSLTDYTSGSSDLINSHDSVLRVTKFIGYCPYETYENNTVTFGYSYLQTPLTVRLLLSSGKSIVRDPVPFYNLFSPARRYFDCDGILQAQEFVRAIVDAPDGFTTRGGFTNVGIGDLSIGMIGYRVLKTPQGQWR